ncbi:MAG: FAD-binding protein [Clostridiales bacterium]|nr:FAD-binding protein [Clostridiales bacterium]
MPYQNVKQLRTDVLIVGGGGAGITAAISSAKNGADVLIASKGKVGNSGNTIMIGGSYAMDGESAYHDYGIKEADPKLTKKVLFDSIINDGFHISDQNLVEQFVEESPWIVNEVRLWAEKAGQKFKFGKPATWAMSGRAMGRALYQGLIDSDNIDFLEDVMVVELIKKNDTIIGAIAIDIYSGEMIEINSKSVVLGTGGFQPFSLKNTNSDMTGDGIAMAFRAGAKVADMEFLLFLLTALEPNEIKGSIMPVYFTFFDFKYKVTDRDGNEVVIPPELKAIEGKSELCKLIDLYYYGKVVSEGKGTENDGVYFDFSDSTDEEINSMFEGLMDYYSNFYKKGYYHADSVETYRDIILKNRRIKVSMGNEYTLGGIVINEKMETSLKGLYAAGECTSGTFGANRVADAVVEMMVQGYRAGVTAAEYAKGATFKENREMSKKIVETYLSYFDNSGGISAAIANIELENISDKAIHFLRNENDLNNAIIAYEKLEEKLKSVSLHSKSKAYNFEWISAIQAKNRLQCAKLAAIMAKERKESRGLHLRSDFPMVDNERYLIRQMAELLEGQIVITSRSPIVTSYDLPIGQQKDYFSYILEHEMGLENLLYNEQGESV